MKDSFDKPTELSLEQQFDVAAFITQVNEMSESQAKQTLINFYSDMKRREIAYQHLLKHQWGLDSSFIDET